MVHKEDVRHDHTGGLTGGLSLFLGLLIGSIVVLLPLGKIVPIWLGVDPADYSDGANAALFSAALAALAAEFCSPSGTRATVLAVLAGVAVAGLGFAGFLGADLYLALGEERGPATVFALRLGSTVPALAVAGLAIYVIAPRGAAHPVPEAPAAGGDGGGVRRGFDEAGAGIATMVFGFLAMFGGWEALGHVITGFPHPAMLSVPALFGAVLAGALAFGMRVEGRIGHVKSFLGGMGLVALVWITATAAVLVALPAGGQPPGPGEQWDAALTGTFAGFGVILAVHGVFYYLSRRERGPRTTPASAGASGPAVVPAAPAHSITALVLLVVLWGVAQTIWPEDKAMSFVIAAFGALSLIRTKPYGLAAWIRALWIGLAIYVLLLGGFVLAGEVADRWAGDSFLLSAALMLVIVIPAALMAMTLPDWMQPGRVVLARRSGDDSR